MSYVKLKWLKDNPSLTIESPNTFTYVGRGEEGGPSDFILFNIMGALVLHPTDGGSPLLLKKIKDE